MAGSFSTAFKGSAYLIGAVTGAALMVPLTAAALGTGAMARINPQPVAIEGIGPSAAYIQSNLINRTAKGSRLESRAAGVPSATTPAGSGTQSSVVKTAGPGAPTTTPSRAMRTPKGCLSAIGVTKKNLATEELTVCVASIDTVNNIY